MNKNIAATVVGSVNMDMVINAPRRPEIGESIIGGGFFISPGGKGANQAVACARMGAKTRFVGMVGRDVFGENLRESLKSFGVITEHLMDSDTNTGVAMITIVDGDNFIVTDAGSNAALLPDTIAGCMDMIAGSDAVLLQFEIPFETNRAIIEHCVGKTTIFLNPAPAAVVDLSVLNGVDFFTPNETEAPFYTGNKINSDADAFTSLDALRELGVRYPMVTLGENGTAYFNGEKNIRRKAYKVEAVDTTAAGDTFAGALAYAYASGGSVGDAVDFASAAAALSVTRRGAQASIPSRDEVIELLATGR